MTGPVGEGVRGNSEMVAALSATPGAIGYAEVGQARRAGLAVVRLVNASGATVAAMPDAIRTAMSGAAWTPERAGPVHGR